MDKVCEDRDKDGHDEGPRTHPANGQRSKCTAGRKRRHCRGQLEQPCSCGQPVCRSLVNLVQRELVTLTEFGRMRPLLQNSGKRSGHSLPLRHGIEAVKDVACR